MRGNEINYASPLNHKDEFVLCCSGHCEPLVIQLQHLVQTCWFSQPLFSVFDRHFWGWVQGWALRGGIPKQTEGLPPQSPDLFTALSAFLLFCYQLNQVNISPSHCSRSLLNGLLTSSVLKSITHTRASYIFILYF